MLLSLLTLVHVLISLAGILAGFVVLFGLLAGKDYDRWTTIFLVTTVATSVTGFLFPFHQFLPSHATGVLSLVALAAAIFARHYRHLTGHWRKVYVIGAVLSLYFNVFVAIVQAFLKIPALHEIAPTQSDPPFQVTQLVVLVLFVALGVAATLRFRVNAGRELALE